MSQNIFDDAAFFSSYMDIRLKPNGHNELIEKPALLSLLPEIKGLRILDLGCGHGDMCRYFLAQGAKSVCGVDVSSEMIRLARTYPNPGEVEYFNLDMASLSRPDASFDLITSSLAIHYIDDYVALVRKAWALLCAGGHFVFSVEHPIYTAPMQGPGNSWGPDADSRREFWKIDSYVHEGKRVVEWLVSGVEKYHRKTETYLNDLIGNGFKINAVLEPCADARVIAENPELSYEAHRPPFLLISAQKPA